MRFLMFAVPAAMLLAGSALAQSSASDGGFTRGTQPMSNAASNLPGQPQASPNFAPSLPTPEVSGDKPSEFLKSARRALAAGRTGEAQQAMEMAQTRMLDRSVAMGQTGVPSRNPTVLQIQQALDDLGRGDRAASLQKLEAAIASAVEQGR